MALAVGKLGHAISLLGCAIPAVVLSVEIFRLSALREREIRKRLAVLPRKRPDID